MKVPHLYMQLLQALSADTGAKLQTVGCAKQPLPDACAKTRRIWLTLPNSNINKHSSSICALLEIVALSHPFQADEVHTAST